MDMDNLKTILDNIKTLDWRNALVSFFVVKRRLLADRSAEYDVLHVEVDEKLRKKLRDIAAGKIKQSNTALEYDFNTADLDDNLLGIPTAETDLQGIINVLQNSEDPPKVGQYEELLGTSMYIARLDIDEQLPLFSVRRVSDSWTTKKVVNLISMVFRDSMLVDLDQQEIFRIDGRVDFFAFDGTLFIADKKRLFRERRTLVLFPDRNRHSSRL
uniref:DUF4868 domain-containing protein n=1 Tax=Candidatus Kentrum sp. TUN TaxID=2126343 RepID=A0A451AXC3_9GAMM|nr:MAG: protein of unknown function (DUF4868) [Candidatus Kentron sp. TUN]